MRRRRARMAFVAGRIAPALRESSATQRGWEEPVWKSHNCRLGQWNSDSITGLQAAVRSGDRWKPMRESLLHFALDRGINLIDTARAYGDAERIIGEALRERRHEYVLG